MTDLRVNEGVKLGGLPEGWVNAHALQRVILWDIGPEPPRPPAKPVAPKGKDGDPEFELAKVEFEEQIDVYRQALKAFKLAREDYADWHGRNGGAIEIDFWSCDAADALGRDGAALKAKRQGRLRYYISSRTRGYRGDQGHRNEVTLQNRGLPEGTKPGRGQAELERRMREGDADMAAALRRDPVFGEQELRS